MLAADGQVGTFREVLTRQAVRVLVRSPLSRALRVRPNSRLIERSDSPASNRSHNSVVSDSKNRAPASPPTALPAVRWHARLSAVGSPVDTGPESQVVVHEEIQLMIAAADRLGKADQEVLRLAGWEELDRDELAAALDCSPNAMTKRLNRALDRLAHGPFRFS